MQEEYDTNLDMKNSFSRFTLTFSSEGSLIICKPFFQILRLNSQNS